MMQLGKAWAAERKRKGLAKVVIGLPAGQRDIDLCFLENEVFLGKDGEMSAHIVQQLAQTGAADLIRRILAAKVDVNTPDRSGRCAVHYAASKGQGIALMELLRNKADVNAQDRLGKTPLHLAVEAGNALMVKELVLATAGLELLDRAGRSPLLLAILLDKRSKQTQPGLYTQSVPLYLAAVGAVLGTADRDGRNAYHYAVQAGDLDMLSGLCAEASSASSSSLRPSWPLSSPSLSSSPSSSRTSTPSTSSLSRPGTTAAVKAAVLAAMRALNAQDAQGLSPLALAAAKGHTEAVARLLDARADLHATSANGMQPLHWAIPSLSMPTCQLLISHKADVRKVAITPAATAAAAAGPGEAATTAPPLVVPDDAVEELLSPLGMAARCGFSALLTYLLWEAQLPFEYGVPQAQSGVHPGDVLAVLQHAPPHVVNRCVRACVRAVHHAQTWTRPGRKKAHRTSPTNARALHARRR
jgi:ankyrin repeat protein